MPKDLFLSLNIPSFLFTFSPRFASEFLQEVPEVTRIVIPVLIFLKVNDGNGAFM